VFLLYTEKSGFCFSEKLSEKEHKEKLLVLPKTFASAILKILQTVQLAHAPFTVS